MNLRCHVTFSEYLCLLRKRKELRQNAVAIASGIDPSYLAALEGGRRSPPNRELLDRIVSALGLDELQAQTLRRLAYSDSLERHFKSFGPSDWPESLQDIVPQIAALPDGQLAALRLFVQALNGATRDREIYMDP
jgi:transcriptional regulator with XRE-family HTH domain